MHRWESSLQFNGKVMKLPLTIDSFLAEIHKRRWATDARHDDIPCKCFNEEVSTPKYILTLAQETDLLEILVIFTKQSEFMDNDLLTSFHYIEDVEL